MSINDILHNVEIYCGSLFPLSLTLTDDNDVVVNLTGYAAYCEIRDRPGGNLLATPTVQVTPGSGQVYIFLTPAQTKAFGAARASIDVVLIEIADPTNVRPILRGDVSVFPQITIIQKTMNGATHSGTKVIDGIASTTGLCAGMTVTGVGIGVGAVINTVDSGVQVTLTVNSTASATVSLLFVL